MYAGVSNISLSKWWSKPKTLMCCDRIVRLFDLLNQHRRVFWAHNRANDSAEMNSFPFPRVEISNSVTFCWIYWQFELCQRPREDQMKSLSSFWVPREKVTKGSLQSVFVEVLLVPPPPWSSTTTISTHCPLIAYHRVVLEFFLGGRDEYKSVR